MFLEFSEQQWLDRLRMGNEQALKYFIVLYEPVLKSMVEKMVDNTGEAEDIVSETFTVLWQQRATIDSPAYLRNYLRQVAKHRSIDYLRSRERIKMHGKERPVSWQEEEAAAEAEMNRMSDLEQLNRLSKKLSPVCRRIYELHYIEGMSMEEIAEKTNRSWNTIRNQLSKIRNSLTNLFVFKRP